MGFPRTIGDLHSVGMSVELHYIYLLCLLLGLPLCGISQTSASGQQFYQNLGEKDAIHELSLEKRSAEDEKDFWVEQLQFEKQLQEKDSTAYQAYLTGKRLLYLDHQILCGNRCSHSPIFKEQMYYYLGNGPSAISDRALTLQTALGN